MLEVEFVNPDNAMGLQNALTAVFYEQLLPQMEELFNAQTGKDEYAFIEKLEIDCGIVHPDNWEQQLAAEFVRKLKAALREVNTKKMEPGQMKAEKALESFFFYVEKGYLPWNKPAQTVSALEPLLLINKSLVERIKMLLAAQPKLAERLAGAFSTGFVMKLIEMLEKSNHSNYVRAPLQRNSGNAIIVNQQHEMAEQLQALCAENPARRDEQLPSPALSPSDGITEAGRRSEDVQDAQGKGMKTADIASKERGDVSEEAIYLENAGLVLLHPFLPPLFAELGLLKDNEWIKDSSPVQAVAALAFLATGTEAGEECTMMLNKVMCALPVSDIVSTVLPLPLPAQQECDALLREVIQHWRILKNTSIDGLREGFLQRNGKLSRVNDGWLLQVEQRTIDILLGHLPWGIGIVRLPWMKETLFVEWA